MRLSGLLSGLQGSPGAEVDFGVGCHQRGIPNVRGAGESRLVGTFMHVAT